MNRPPRNSSRKADPPQEPVDPGVLRGRADVQLSTLLEHLSDVVVYETSEEWSVMSDNIRNLTGFTPEQVQEDPQTFWRNIHEDDVDRIREATERWKADDSPGSLTIEFRLRCADGQYKWIEDREVLIRPKGAPEYIVGVLVDISDRKEAELRAERSAGLESLSRRVISTFADEPDLSLAIDEMLSEIGSFFALSRVELVRFRDQNESAFLTHAWSDPKEGEPPHESRSLDARDWSGCLAHIESAGRILCEDLRRSPPPEGRLPRHWLVREPRALLVLPVPIDGDIQMLIALEERRTARTWSPVEIPVLTSLADSMSRAIERRIRERERQAAAERLREALERAESASTLKTRFLRSMSHELRSPVTVVLGFSELLEHRERSPELAAEFGSSIRRNAEFLLSLLDDLLDLSRIEAGQMRVDLRPVPLAELLHTVLDLLRVPAAAKGLELRLRQDGPVPTVVVTDGLRVRQILLNLVGNAIRYTDAGSVELTSRLEVPEDGANPGEARLRFQITDTGIGIPEEALEHIFEPFQQLGEHTGGEPTGSASRGTGLGLDISRRLARWLSGEISVRSEVGVGSDFSLVVPIGTAAELEMTEQLELEIARVAATARQPATAPLRLPGIRLLLVEDSVEIRRFLCLLLEDEGAEVDVAADGGEAVERALAADRDRQPYDAILMDLQMQVVDGYEATRQLREAGQVTPIIALTAHAFTDERDAALQAGCTAWLPKPVHREMLLETLRREVEKHRPIDSLDPGSVQAAPSSGRVVDSRSRAARDEALAKGRERYRRGLAAKADQLDDATSLGDRQSCHTLVHRLHGSAASFGLASLGELARELDRALSDASTDLEDVAAALHELARRMRELSESA